MNTQFISPPDTTRNVTLLGYEPMDKIHGEFESLVKQTLTCPDANLPQQIDLLKQHLQEHFGAEDKWMNETNFPAKDCHISEHAAVLRSADEVCRHVHDGNLAIGRTFAVELEKWFGGHADYLDSALAHWINKLRFGGKPVVLHRNSPVNP